MFLVAYVCNSIQTYRVKGMGWDPVHRNGEGGVNGSLHMDLWIDRLRDMTENITFPYSVSDGWFWTT